MRHRYNWNDITYFLAVARERSLVRAAEKLRVDHTTVSRRIRELETRLNASLFTRSKTGFKLTETGYRLLRYAEGMEAQANAIAEEIGITGADASGSVRIATMEGLGSFYLTQCLPDLQSRHPSIQIDLITDSLLLDLSRREADLFVTFSKPTGRRLSIRKIGEFKVSLFAARDYLDRHGVPTSIAALNDHVFIDFIDELVQVSENRWLSDIFRPHHLAFRSTSLVAQYMSVCNGQGISMLPSFIAAGNRDLVPILPKLFAVRDIWLSAHEDFLHVARIKAVMAFLETRVNQDKDLLMPGVAPGTP